MPLPPIIQPIDTFNTWFDATNNVISHIGNTSAYIQVAQNATPSVSTGNVALNGIATITQVVATGNVVLGGVSSTCATPVFSVVNNATPTLNVIATTVGISAVTTEFSGSNLNIASNTQVNGIFTAQANASFTKNVSFSGANTDIGGGRLTVTANAQFAANTNVAGTTFNVTANSVLQGNVIINATSLIVNAATTFNEGLILGGPVSWSNAHIFNTTLTGDGIQSLVLGANVTILRINATGSGNLISSIQAVNTSQYRHLTVFNISPNPIYFQHGNTAASTNSIYCPGNTDFMIPTQGTAILYYDANNSVQRWRVMSAPIGVDPLATVSASGMVGYNGTQTFGGNKVFQNTVTVTANLSMSNATATALTASFANSSANVQITPRTITFEGTTTINSTAYTGTSNNSTYLNGQLASYYTSASNLSTGNVPDARIAGAYTGITSLSVGANVIVNTTTVFLGNSSVNSVYTASTLSIYGNSTVNTVITSASANSITVNGLTLGYLEVPQNSQSAAYGTVRADSGKHIFHPSSDNNARTFTIPANSNVAYPTGTVLTFINMSNTVTIAVTTDTLYLSGNGATGSRTLAANGIATAIKINSSAWLISGTGLA